MACDKAESATTEWTEIQSQEFGYRVQNVDDKWKGWDAREGNSETAIARVER